MSKTDHHRQLGPDILRALAVSLVFLSHSVPWSSTADKLGIKPLAFWGYQMDFWGVEIFFVLSGYLIGGILLVELFSGRLLKIRGLFDFWKRRWFRTLPNYYLFLILFFVVAWTLDDPARFKALPYINFSQALLGTHPVFFGTAWSLAVEEWFYLLFPLVLIIIARICRRPQSALTASISIFILIPILLRWFVHLPAWDIGYRQSTFMRLDALMYGVALACIKHHTQHLWKRLISIWWIGAGLLLALMTWWYQDWKRNFSLENDSLFHRVFLFSSVSLCLFLLFPKFTSLNEKHVPWKMLRAWILKLSLWSYSIYLSHALIIFFVNAQLSRWEWSIPGLRAAVAFPIIAVITLACSAFLYRFYEQPVMKLRDKV